MPEYEFMLEEKIQYSLKVEAKTEDEAGALAIQLWEDSEDPTYDFDHYAFGVTIVSVERIRGG